MNPADDFTQHDEQMKRGIGVSFALHALVISFFVLKAAFFTPESIDFSQAVRVDIVGLPDKVQELPPAPAKPEPKAAPPVAKEKPKPEKKTPPPKPEVKMPPKTAKADPEAVNLNKVKSKQQNALEKLKAMSALEKIKEDVAREQQKSAAAAAAEAAKVAAIKGNQVSAGTALSGLSKLQHDNYVADLDHHIKQKWTLPEWLAGRDLSAQVRVNIDSRGLVIAKKIVKSSGNPSYDEAVLQTIDLSAPFPPPPSKFLSLVEVDGILIGFPE